MRACVRPSATPDCLRCAVLATVPAIPPEQPEHDHVATVLSSFDSSLMVRDTQGRLLATAEQILDAARRAIERKMQRGTSFIAGGSQENTCAPLAGFEHEVFAVLFLDTHHRLIECAEMFRGTIDGASVYPRLVKEALRQQRRRRSSFRTTTSGNPEPSQADKVLTQRLNEAQAGGRACWITSSSRATARHPSPNAA